ncbi:hypothetical protein [Bradyrhizobium sp. CCBAU 53421]|uniref:hypothetical protein n=1 Tax=Bradyrhizobium sp. CCBAU 53421 TaxID=1325120 RepID=UPI0018C0E3E6|nr:hypothetical protein [Bradyrhizobium sp. CCBAU 53421]QOZ36911.1 hypothetical protein XH92_39605 [Bradyrhizobium sp. CCBAU 53421]
MTDIKLPKQVVDRIEARWTSRYRPMEKQHSRLIDRRLEQLRAHRNNIWRYRRLLKTQLSELERQFIERRLAEELEAVERVASDVPPIGTRLMSIPAAETSGESPP